MKKKNKGFLLLEVLFTVVVVSASVVFINHAFSSSLKAISLTNSYNEAIIFLDDKIFDIEFNMHLSEISNFSRQETYANTVYLLEQKIMPLDREDLSGGYDEYEIGVEKLSFDMSWEKDGKRSIELSTYIPVIESQ